MNPNDPAFPSEFVMLPGSGYDKGMPIRLYIATHALQGLLAADWDLPYEELASLALQVADALIEQEKKSK